MKIRQNFELLPFAAPIVSFSGTLVIHVREAADQGREVVFILWDRLVTAQGMKTGGITMEPIMCPFCGGTNLFQEDDYGLEMDFEYWTVHHWECLDCAQSFDKIEILPTTNTFEEINESTIH